jgi:hypothetical protein
VIFGLPWPGSPSGFLSQFLAARSLSARSGMEVLFVNDAATANALDIATTFQDPHRDKVIQRDLTSKKDSTPCAGV